MTERQLYAFSVLALAISVAVGLLTRATPRRILGAMAGAATAGRVSLGIIALGEKVRLWHMAIDWRPYLLALLLINVTLCAYVFLISGRIARRFGGRGLVMAVMVAALIGPP